MDSKDSKSLIHLHDLGTKHSRLFRIHHRCEYSHHPSPELIVGGGRGDLEGNAETLDSLTQTYWDAGVMQ